MLNHFLSEREREFETRFIFGKQYPVEGEEYTIVGHKHDENCEFGCDKKEKIKEFNRETARLLLEEVKKKAREIPSATRDDCEQGEDVVLRDDLLHWLDNK